jgi:hypothetical protein
MSAGALVIGLMTLMLRRRAHGGVRGEGVSPAAGVRAAGRAIATRRGKNPKQLLPGEDPDAPDDDEEEEEEAEEEAEEAARGGGKGGGRAADVEQPSTPPVSPGTARVREQPTLD